jgi:hypothetical protein
VEGEAAVIVLPTQAPVAPAVVVVVDIIPTNQHHMLVIVNQLALVLALDNTLPEVVVAVADTTVQTRMELQAGAAQV